ncbi:MAG: hypothetical protein EBW14_21990 [Oxalobacteraceae bacterium]|nr:hypothetical protein [Oxalobacteraceae bacterium]
MIQKLPVDDFGSHIGEESFLLKWEFSEQKFGDHQVQDGITKKFKTLVGAMKAQGFQAMHQRVGECQFIEIQLTNSKTCQGANALLQAFLGRTAAAKDGKQGH